jgi:hypothetical protein
MSSRIDDNYSKILQKVLTKGTGSWFPSVYGYKHSGIQVHESLSVCCPLKKKKEALISEGRIAVVV